MSYRRLILERLKDFYDHVGGQDEAYLLLDPIDIIGKTQDKEYVAAIDQLLREGLIRAALPEGSDRPVFSINTARIRDILRELR